MSTIEKTEYKVINENGTHVLEARSESAASGLLQEVLIDPNIQRHISWRWKAPQLIPAADNTRRNADDSPVRIVIAFDGDKKKFDFEDRAMAELSSPAPSTPELSIPMDDLMELIVRVRGVQAKEGEVVAMLTEASRDISSRLGCTKFPLDTQAS